jgi:hypothetical protein
VNTPYDEQHRRPFILFDVGPSADVGTVLHNLANDEIFGVPEHGLVTQFSGGRGLAPVPEPSTLVLLGAAVIGMAGRTWRRKKQRHSGTKV